jgi:hypothetical protein
MRVSPMRLTSGITLALPLLLAACALITHYDPTSYKNATDLKAEALILMDQAKEPPATHAAAIDAVLLKLQQAYEYERGKGDPNRFTVGQWAILVDPNRDLLGGFLRKWRADNAPQGAVFIDEKKKQVAKAFDEIIALERAKVK